MTTPPFVADTSGRPATGDATVPPAGDARHFLATALVFTFVGLMLYAGVYALSERLVYQHAQTNRFFLIKTAPRDRYDYVILGASHAAALGYQDMTARLEEMTGASIINLSVVGGGVRVSRLVFDYFLAGHHATTLVYVIDSFAFYSKQWNEERLQDTRLFVRAPFDPPLAALLLGERVTRSMAFDYLAGFSKINNHDRFAADVTPEETTRFNRAYRPVRQIDDQRLEYLYPKTIDSAAFDGYLSQFESLIQLAQNHNMQVIVIKPPIPERIARQIPGEDQFDARLKQILERHHAEFHDFTHIGNDDRLFYDTDHLNREGVLNFFEHSLAPVLARKR
jgi:hypothetical protein